jgi:prepilin-type N-terminal cleavage/methylation domain-containing protein
MAKGFSLIELALVLLIAGALALVAAPHLRAALDRIATDRAALEVTTAFAVARAGAVSYGTRARVLIAADTLRIDRMAAGEWVPWWRRPGPDDFGVRLEVSNPEVIFGPTGLGWGASNTAVALRRGSQVETITTSRLGRVKRW